MFLCSHNLNPLLPIFINSTLPAMWGIQGIWLCFWNFLLSHILLFQHFLNCIHVNLLSYIMFKNSFKTQLRIYSQNLGYYFPRRCTIHICILNILRNFIINQSLQLNLTQHFPYLCYDGNNFFFIDEHYAESSMEGS